MCQICGMIEVGHTDSNVSTGAYTTTSSKPVAGLSQAIQYLTTQWPGQVGYGRSWSDTSLSYSMPSSAPEAGSTEASGFKPMTAAMKAAAREAFELWDDLVAISLTETTATTADLTFAYSTRTSGGGNYARTYTSYHGGTELTLTRGAVWLNASTHTHDTDADMAYGGYGRLTYVHEIGHTLGLSHPGVYDVTIGGVISYAASALYAQDTRQFTVMSYFEAGSDGSGLDHVGSDGRRAYAATPLLHDIAAIQDKYGADMTTRTGNTTYGFNSNAGRSAFDFTQNKNPIVAVWDAGGVDTLDVSGFAQNQRVTLVAGAYSDVGAMTKNVAIAFGATIENLVGGSGADQLEGNAVANLIRGGGGNDTIWGGSGNDTLRGEAGNDVLYGGAGADVIEVGAASGADRVSDFTIGTDFIRVSGVSAFTGLKIAAATGGVNVSWGVSGASLFVAGATTSTLKAASFLFGTATAPGTSAPTPAPAPAPAPTPTGQTIYGTAAADTLTGGSYVDSMYGKDGNDVLTSSAGGDVLDGGGWFDTVLYAGSSAGVSLNRVTGVNSGGHAEGDRLTGIERFVLSNHADRFVGTGAAEDVVGGSGADTLAGGGGADRLSGGAGSDLFVFGANAGAATIWDFAPGVDDVRIEAGAARFSDLVLQAEAGGVRVSWGVAGASVLLSGRKVSDLSAGDFIFAGSGTAASMVDVCPEPDFGAAAPILLGLTDDRSDALWA